MFTEEQCLAYLQRIHFPQVTIPKPTLQTLTLLQNLHTQHVPFESLILHVPENSTYSHFPFLEGQGTDISPTALYNKIVVKRRGGFCFELNGCFADLLRKIGFEVHERLARVCTNDPNVPGAGPGWVWLAHTHVLLLVKTSQQDQLYAVDAGFGANGPFSPIEFRDSADAAGITPKETFTLCKEPLPGFPQMTQGWTLYRSHENEHEGRKRACYHFLDTTPLPIDIAMGNWFAATKDRAFAELYTVTTLDASTKVKSYFTLEQGNNTAKFYKKDESGNIIEQREVTDLQEAKNIWKDQFGLVV